MPETDPLPIDPAPPLADSPPTGSGGSMLRKLAVLLFLGAVVLGECLVAYFYLPDATQTAAMASAAAAHPQQDPLPPDDEPEANTVDQIEVDLEQFSVTAFQPVSNTTLRIDFHLYGTVATEDATEFQTLMEKNVHRFREQVIVIVRSAELTDLTDAGLGLIKRRILEKTNDILGKPLLKSVIVSDYSFLEQ